ncbi:hypothetical protein CN490_20950 [Bacillus cereus]|nr:hypothetical protein CN490_20950 [Bacillus cereus]
MGQVKYTVKVKGIEYNEPISFQPNPNLNSHSGINDVEIKFTDFNSDYYDISMIMTVDDSAQVEAFISKILDTFSYKFGMVYKDLMKVSDSRVAASGSITLYNNTNYHLLTQTDSAEIINNLGNPSFEDEILKNPYVSILINSLRIEGAVGRFIQLYGLLQMVVPPAVTGRPTYQRELDDFIRNAGFSFYDVNKDMPSTRPGATANDKDTIYTWLRNQVGHTGSSVDVGDVQNQIEDRANELFIITKTAINNFKI